jgi:hypothetical protein
MRCVLIANHSKWGHTQRDQRRFIIVNPADTSERNDEYQIKTVRSTDTRHGHLPPVHVYNDPDSTCWLFARPQVSGRQDR